MSRDKLPMTGIVAVTGEHDTGKTTFAYTTGVHPDRIAFFDNDMKASEVHRQLKFGAYYDLVRMFRKEKRNKPLDFYVMVKKLIDTLPDDRFDTLVFDNWTQMEEGINSWVDEHIMELSNLSPNQAKNASTFTWPYKRSYYASVLDVMLSKAPLVIITTHIKDQWIGQRKTGLKETRCQQPLAEKASLRLWLRHNPDSQAPIGLVLKRMSISRWNMETGLIEVDSVLPRKVVPCTWEKIRWYLANPIGNRKLGPEEIPDEFELSILDGILTRDQKMMLELAMKAPDADPEAEVAFAGAVAVTGENDTKVMELRAKGLKAPAIAKELGVAVVEVLKILSAHEGESK